MLRFTAKVSYLSGASTPPLNRCGNGTDFGGSACAHRLAEEKKTAEKNGLIFS
jgi:hypothetical protein